MFKLNYARILGAWFWKSRHAVADSEALYSWECIYALTQTDMRL